MVATAAGIVRVSKHLFTVEDYIFILCLWASAMIFVYLLGKYSNVGDGIQSDDENGEDDGESEIAFTAPPSNNPGQRPATGPSARHR